MAATDEHVRPRRRLWRIASRVALACSVALGITFLISRHQRFDGSSVRPIPVPRADVPAPAITVTLVELTAGSETPPWLRDVTAQGFNALLGRFGGLQVVANELVQWKAARSGSEPMTVARDLGVTTVLRGTIDRRGGRILLAIHATDLETGHRIASLEASGEQNDLITIENELGVKLVRALGISVTQADIDRIAALRENVDTDVAKRFHDAFGGADTTQDEPHARGFSWTTEAHAATSGDEKAVFDLAEKYRAALQAADVDAIEKLYVTYTAEMKTGMLNYFKFAKMIDVKFSNYTTVEIDGLEGMVTFTRFDRFYDRRINLKDEKQFDVRVSLIVAKQPDGWKIQKLAPPKV